MRPTDCDPGLAEEVHEPPPAQLVCAPPARPCALLACAPPAHAAACAPPARWPAREAMMHRAHPAGPRHADVLPAEHPPAPPADLNALDPAIWPRGARRVDGVLTLGGIDVRDLAGQYGTPVFALDEEDFRGRCRDFADAFGEQSAVFYAAKAFCCRGVLRWVAEEGLGVDVCTGGGLEGALGARGDPAMINMHRSNKMVFSLGSAVGPGGGDAGVGLVGENSALYLQPL